MSCWPGSVYKNLSQSDPCSDRDVQADMLDNLDEENVQEILGLGHSYDPRSQRELAAKKFAAELLLPFERIRILYLLERISPVMIEERGTPHAPAGGLASPCTPSSIVTKNVHLIEFKENSNNVRYGRQESKVC